MQQLGIEQQFKIRAFQLEVPQLSRTELETLTIQLFSEYMQAKDLATKLQTLVEEQGKSFVKLQQDWGR